jgi:hypothetical protein
MFSIFLSACVLAFLTLVTHATGIAVSLRKFAGLHHLPDRPTRIAQMLLRMIWWLVLVHLAEISMWALFYWWRGLVPDVETAFYFSGVTYTTIGYGDVVMAKPWRLLAPLEGLMGILMLSLSTGYFFVITSSIYQARLGKLAAPSASAR